LEVKAEPKAQRSASGVAAGDSHTSMRVYVTHGKNTQFVELVKKFIRFAKLEPIVTAERQSVAKPVPDKVMDDMRSCGGAIIHVDAERTLIDPEGKEQVVLNPNVLIEIGAAFALYGRRFILLVKDGVQMPSNLQGLYEVRYTGDILDGNTTMKLLEAITDMQNQPLPDRYGSVA
jgi:predicted nucleotide-binding protein